MAISLSGLSWAAGFLEGEGCFVSPFNRTTKKRSSLSVRVAQVQKEPLCRLQKIFGGGGIVFTKAKQKNQANYYVYNAGGSLGAGMMMTLFSLMSPRRKHQIKIAITEWLKQKVYGANLTACYRGHPFTEENTYLKPSGIRVCRICRRASCTAYKQRLKEVV